VLSSRDGIRDRFHTDWHSQWAFHKLKQCVEYEAEQQGVFIDAVNPKNTSKRCNDCGCMKTTVIMASLSDSGVRSRTTRITTRSPSGGQQSHGVTLRRRRILWSCISCGTISRLAGGALFSLLSPQGQGRRTRSPVRAVMGEMRRPLTGPSLNERTLYGVSELEWGR
jgi:hypothetical protein